MLLINMLVSQQEEKWAEISEEATYDYREDLKVPEGVAIEQIRVEVVK